jgi:hypothetical protein
VHGRVSPWLIIGLVILCSALFVVAIGAAVMSAFHRSDAYAGAVSRAAADSEVIARLGAPVTPGYFTTGSIELKNDKGTADLEIPLHGARGAGVLMVGADKANGQWTYRRLELRTAGREPPFNLLRPDSTGSKPPA